MDRTRLTITGQILKGMQEDIRKRYAGDRVRIALFRGRGLMSALIRWQTWSDYSHAALVLPDGSIIEAWQGLGAGVRRKWVNDWEGIDVFDVDWLSKEKSTEVEAFARLQIGKRYDYLGVLRFLNRRKVVSNGRWFCSELVFEAFMLEGIELLARTNSSRVSPGLLARSPLLRKRLL